MNMWWLYWRHRPDLYHTIGRGNLFEKHPSGWVGKKPMDRVLVTARVSKYFSISWQPTNIVFSDATVVISTDSDAEAALLTSAFHNEWAWRNASKMKRDLRYTPTDCFETFPFPKKIRDNEALSRLGQRFFDLRQQYMIENNVGLTEFYNRFHSIDCKEDSIEKTRKTMRLIDEAIALAYGWSDLKLDHNIYEVNYLPVTDRNRFTISDQARSEIIVRLSKLNHERYEEEVAQGLHDKKNTSTPRKKKTSPAKDDGNLDLFNFMNVSSKGSK